MEHSRIFSNETIDTSNSRINTQRFACNVFGGVGGIVWLLCVCVCLLLVGCVVWVSVASV